MIHILHKILHRWGLEYFQRYYATYRATVVDNADPDKLGRLKLSIPQIYGDKEHDYWAWGKGQYAGKDKGFLFLPAVGDSVYVVFENGDARYPIWEHGWWGRDDTITEAKDNYPDVNILKTYKGNYLMFDDKDGIVRLQLKGGGYVEINDKGISLVRGSKKVSLGSLNGSDEPAVLGDKNANQLTDHLDMMKSIIAEMQKFPVAYTPLSPISVAEISAKLIVLQTEIVTLKASVVHTKSKNVTVDG